MVVTYMVYLIFLSFSIPTHIFASTCAHTHAHILRTSRAIQSYSSYPFSGLWNF